MADITNFMIWFVLGEIVAFPVFLILRRHFGPHQGQPVFSIETFKGTLERLVLVVGLLSNYPQIIIAFGAFKIANRLASEQPKSDENDTANDKAVNYFLIGNLLSLLIVFSITYAIENLPLNLLLERT